MALANHWILIKATWHYMKYPFENIYGRRLVESSKKPCLYNSIQKREFSCVTRRFHGKFKQRTQNSSK